MTRAMFHAEAYQRTGADDTYLIVSASMV
jgi:hypothetical protein